MYKYFQNIFCKKHKNIITDITDYKLDEQSNNIYYKQDNISNNLDEQLNKLDLLKTIDEKDIPYFSFSGKTFIAKPCHIYDGDTFSIIFFFHGTYIKYRCRTIGYDSPEMKPLKSNPNSGK